MKKHILLSTVLMIGILISGCSTGKAGKSDADEEERTYLERYEDALEAFESGKYYKCIEDFNFVVFNAPGSDIADDAQFYLATSHYELKEYLLAIDKYQQLLRRWPESDLYEETRFKIAECYYRQSPGYQRDDEYIVKAIRAYQDFIREYPFSEYREVAEERIQELRTGQAKKIYEAGKLYMVLREWKAAAITFEEITEGYYDTPLLNKTYLQMARCYRNLNNTEKTADMLDQIDKGALSASERSDYNKLMKAMAETEQ